MLHWLAGAKAPDGSTDPDATIMDAPETPAPVFAVRAFKHAIFGTPTPQTQGKPRRHSSTERERQRPTLAKPARPPMSRPKSAGDAQTLAKQGDVPEPMPSPTKGILMTPGTAAARRKTVTFGDHVVDNENKKVSEGSKTGLPNDCPGKFPSPWVQPSEKPEKDDSTPNDRRRGRSKLTEELHKARDESAKRKIETVESSQGDNETIADFIEPNSEAGKYWKREYDIYRANTTREVKRLVQKQRSAKSFAAEKDNQCTELADQLRQEKKRADRLERRAAELEAQVKTLQSQLESDRKSTQTNAQIFNGTTTATVPPTLSSKSKDQQPPVPEKFAPASAIYAETNKPLSARDARPSRQQESEDQNQDEPKATRPLRTRHRSGNLPTDIWAQNFSSSNTKPVLRQDAPVAAARNGRTVTSGTDATPLKSLSINARSSVRPSSRDGPQPVPDRVRSNNAQAVLGSSSATSAQSREQNNDDLHNLTIDLPHASQDEASRRPRLTTTLGSSDAVPKDDPHSPLMGQPPFMEDALPLPSTPTPTPKVSSTRQPIHIRTESKENHSPVRKAAAVPSAADEKDVLQVPRQSAVPAGGAMRSKDGREVSADRLEAARARLAARGVRHVS